MVLLICWRKIRYTFQLYPLCVLILGICAIFTWRRLYTGPWDDKKPPQHAQDASVNCKAVLAEDPDALAQALKWNTSEAFEEQILSFQTKLKRVLTSGTCDTLKDAFHFNSAPGTPEEKQFPLALVLMVYNNTQQFMELMEAIYWPQNVYCITYDRKSDSATKSIIHLLNGCFHNIILPEKHEVVKWGDITVLLAALNCIRKVAESPFKWKYVQIVDHKDFPLKTNYEMVQIFKILNGTNDIELNMGSRFRHTGLKPPPYNMTIYKGSFSPSLTPDFVDFVLNSQPAQDLLRWLNNTLVPDEHFFSTLLYNQHLSAPKTYPGTCWGWKIRDRYLKGWISRYQLWNIATCQGKMMRGSCVFGLKDLKSVVAQPHLFVHKFMLNFEPAALHCLREWFVEKQAQEPHSLEESAANYYRSLPMVKYHFGNASDC